MFNKETEYALRSLVYVQAQNLKGRKPGVDEISGATEAPRHFTAKILHRLVRGGFLLSTKGKGGGFFLDSGKPSVNLLEVVNAVEGSKIFSGCVFGLKECSHDNPCPLHYKYKSIRDSIEELLSTETVLSLAEKYPAYQ
jgi:Rrf2 family transcriptional regulator, iron-sulfur cluster assembly transcription factor